MKKKLKQNQKRRKKRKKDLHDGKSFLFERELQFEL
jgi:hypothetical protein